MYLYLTAQFTNETIDETLGYPCYCSEKPAVKTTVWHADFVDSDEDPMSEDNSGSNQGLQLIANAAKRVWEEVYICKKPVSFMWKQFKLKNCWKKDNAEIDCKKSHVNQIIEVCKEYANFVSKFVEFIVRKTANLSEWSLSYCSSSNLEICCPVNMLYNFSGHRGGVQSHLEHNRSSCFT